MSKMMRRAVPWLLLVVLLIGITPRKVEAAVRLNKNSATVGIHQTMTLKVTGTNAKVKWKSSNKKVATVSSKGIVTGRKKGTVTITAKVKRKKYKCRVTVVQSVTKVKLNRFAVVMKKGESMGIKATVSPWNANNRSVTWKSSNPKVATVNKYGAVKAVGKGNATITAVAKDGSWKKASCRVTVRQPVTGLRMNRASTSIKKGSSISLGAVASPWDASNKSVTWKSSNTRVATVDSKGTVRAVGKGAASITATANDGSGKRSSCTVTVTQPVTGISLNRASASLKIGNTLSLSAAVSPWDANNRNVTWKSSNTRVATVNSAGSVKAVGKGTASITATANDGSGKSSACRVTVTEPAPAAPQKPEKPAEPKEPEKPVEPKEPEKTEEAETDKTDSTAATEDPVTDAPESSGADDKQPSGENDDTETVVSIGATASEEETDSADTGSLEATESAHTHTWVDLTKTVHHNEKSHTEKKQVGTETVVDKEAWDEDVYKTVAKCSACGYFSEDEGKVDIHTIKEHNGEASWSINKVKTNTIHHDAVTHEEPVFENVKVVDEEAWDEIMVAGQKCSGCGVTR